MTLQALPYVVLLGMMFGTTLIASRFSVGQFAPTTYIGLRLVIASGAHALFYALNSRRRWPTDAVLWQRAVLLGIFGTALPMTGIVSSLQYQSSGVTSVLLTASPALTVLFAHFTLPDERINPRKSAGVALALLGALLLALLGESGLPDVTRASPLGYALVLGAMLAAAASTIYARKYLRAFDSFDVANIRMVVAALTVMPLSALFIGVDLGGVDRQGTFALGYASLVGTFSAMYLSLYIIQRFGATPTAMTSYVIPVVATVGGALLLGETVTRGMLAGMVLIVLGITILNRRTDIVT